MAYGVAEFPPYVGYREKIVHRGLLLCKYIHSAQGSVYSAHCTRTVFLRHCVIKLFIIFTYL